MARRYWYLSFVLATCLAALGRTQETADAVDEKPEIHEQTIYVPYEKLQETFERTGRGVYLPYEKFQELWQAARQAQPTPQLPESPPAKALITQIESEAFVRKDVMQVESTVTIAVLADGWIDIPLSLADSAILSATIDGEPAKLVARDDGQHLLFQHSEGADQTVSLKLTFARSFDQTPGQNSVSFRPPLAPVHRWLVRIPETQSKVKVFPMLAATENPDSESAGDEDEDDGSEDNATSTDNETRLLAFVGATPTVRIEWTPKSEGATGLEALVSVQSQTQVSILPGTVRTVSQLNYQISRSELSQLTLMVPSDHRVVDVVDPNIRAWNVAATDNGQQIVIDLFQPANGSQSVRLELEQFRNSATDAAEFVPPQVVAENVGRQRGVVVVRLADELRAETVRRNGLSQLDASELDAVLQKTNWTFAFGFANPDYDLAIRVETVEPSVSVRQWTELSVEPRQLTARLLAVYEIRRTGVFDLSVNVPEAFEIVQIVGSDAGQGKTPVQVDSFARDTSDPTLVNINLSAKAIGDVGLMVHIRRTLDDANLLSPTGEATTFDIPQLKVADAELERSEGWLTLFAPEGLRIRTNSTVGLQNAAIEQNVASQQLPKPNGVRPIQSFRYGTGTYSGVMEIERRQPQVTASQRLVARFEPGVVHYQATVTYQIRYSSVSQLRLDIPSSIAESIRVEPGDLKETQISPAPEDLSADYVAWQLGGDSELIGTKRIQLTWDEPLTNLEVGKSLAVAVPRLIPQDVEQSSGHIVLVKTETIDILPDGTPTGLIPIDPNHDLDGGAKIPDASAALEFHADWQLSLQVTRYQLESLKQTSIERAFIRAVQSKNDRLSVQALYRLRSNQQRLEFTLPGQSNGQSLQMDSQPVRINGQPVTLEKAGDQQSYYVPLLGHNSNQPFVLEIRYSLEADDAEIDFPRFPSEPASQKTSLLTYIPNDAALVKYDGPWSKERAETHKLNQLVEEIAANIMDAQSAAGQFAVEGQPLLFTTLQAPNDGSGKLQLTVVPERMLYGGIFGAVVLLGIMLLRTNWTTRIGITAALVAVALLLGVFWPSLISFTMDQTLMLASCLVGLLWGAAELPRWAQRLRDVWPSGRTKATADEDPFATADESSPPDASAAAQENTDSRSTGKDQ